MRSNGGDGAERQLATPLGRSTGEELFRPAAAEPGWEGT